MANCETCKGKEQIPEQSKNELAFAYIERTVKRQWIALIIALCMLFASNAVWLYAWMQYDYTSEETIVDVNSDDGGNANYIGIDGDIVNGESDRTETEKNQNP